MAEKVSKNEILNSHRNPILYFKYLVFSRCPAIIYSLNIAAFTGSICNSQIYWFLGPLFCQNGHNPIFYFIYPSISVLPPGLPPESFPPSLSCIATPKPPSLTGAELSLLASSTQCGFMSRWMMSFW